MSRKLIAALIGLAAFILGCIVAPVQAASNQITRSAQGGYHVLFIPSIVLIAFLIFGGYLTIEFLLWAFKNHRWPFDGSFFK